MQQHQYKLLIVYNKSFSDRKLMSSKKKIDLPYWQDPRTQEQKLRTKEQAQDLSNQNHKRSKPSLIKNIDSDNNLPIFVTVSGVPPHKDQFKGLKFPGKVYNFLPPCFRPLQQETQQMLQKILPTISMQNTVKQLNDLVDQKGGQQKGVIFIYHSFGCSIVANYCSVPEYHQKIKGLICLGGSPVYFYPIVKDYTKSYLSIPNINRQFIIDNYQVVYSLYDEKTKNNNNWTRFENKYQLLSFNLHNDLDTLRTLFGKIRSMPKPILMIYGDKDMVLTPELCTETMMEFCKTKMDDKQKLGREKLRSMLDRYEAMHGVRLKDLGALQSKLVYLTGGGHSFHIKEQKNQQLQPLIDEYLQLILPQLLISNKTLKQTKL